MIISLDYSRPSCKKLIDMGATRGTRFTVENVAPFKTAAQIRLRGYLLAVRTSDLKGVELRYVDSLSGKSEQREDLVF